MVAQTTVQSQTPERTIEILGTVAPVAKWQDALARAHQNGIRVQVLGGQWFATSASHPGALYLVNGTCHCEGASRGHLCQHLAAVRSAQASQGLLARCEVCGRVDFASRMHFEQRHVGGIGEVGGFYCNGTHAPNAAA